LATPFLSITADGAPVSCAMTAGAAAASTNANIAINIINFLNSYPLLTKGFPLRSASFFSQPSFCL
jgi:hypothetical protein